VRERLLAGDGHVMHFPLAVVIFPPVTRQMGAERLRGGRVRRIGWAGRRAAYLSAIGFAIVLLNFVPISYFIPQSHNF